MRQMSHSLCVSAFISASNYQRFATHFDTCQSQSVGSRSHRRNFRITLARHNSKANNRHAKRATHFYCRGARIYSGIWEYRRPTTITTYREITRGCRHVNISACADETIREKRNKWGSREKSCWCDHNVSLARLATSYDKKKRRTCNSQRMNNASRTYLGIVGHAGPTAYEFCHPDDTYTLIHAIARNPGSSVELHASLKRDVSWHRDYLQR